MADPAANEHVADVAHSADAAHAASGAAHSDVFPPLDASLYPSQLIWFALTFAALYFFVSKFIIPKVGGVLAKREGTLKSDLDAAALKSVKAEEARTAMEKAAAKARADARAMVDAARAEVTAKLTAEQVQAEARLAERIGAAEAKVNAARAAALADIPGVADALARDIAAKLVPANA